MRPTVSCAQSVSVQHMCPQTCREPGPRTSSGRDGRVNGRLPALRDCVKLALENVLLKDGGVKKSFDGQEQAQNVFRTSGSKKSLLESLRE